ncbi:hypothetical protein [Nocardia sp. XZ_19_231]|uniref:hypothetical protein n=1 Tax=Nocardia sp. XZ_19_231 TaxID=2769252 RepID=UPI0018907AD6|nr:hypothetical protein [Nocardia sp. XZ_19_231]
MATPVIDNLDSRTGADIMNPLAAIAHDTLRAVVMVTHDQQAAEGTDRVTSLRDGRIHSDESCTPPPAPDESSGA